jgi:predicted acylesterase/phospholipase RssA/lysylphosphatidylglycerol synthetase-like protein (DUF2156 family)
MATNEARWWEARSLRLVNGVFKGGGAKGIAYAGALQAFLDAGQWFGSVAGASAGAITASLIAAGVDPHGIAEQVPVALGKLQGRLPVRLARIVGGMSSSLFESGGLRELLGEVYDAQLTAFDVAPTGEGGKVCFDDLYRATGIELYVVVMDLASGTPVVFSRRTTPRVEVAGAVVSSCAIPGAFPPGRAVFDHETRGATVHELVDGGTWANYPAFVFKDASFRLWSIDHATRNMATADVAGDPEAGRPTVGFVLGEPASLDGRVPLGFLGRRPRLSQRFDVGPTSTSSSTGSFLVGAVLGNDIARLVLGSALVTWLVLSVLLFPTSLRRLTNWLTWLPDLLYPTVLVALVSLLVLAAMAALFGVIAIVAMSRLFADTVVPAGQAALGVATGVAPWVGTAPDDILLVVPYGSLSTTRFDVAADAQARAADDARRSVAAQLASPALATKLGLAPSPPESTPAPAAERAPGAVLVERPRGSLTGALIAALLTLVIGLAGWWAADRVPFGGRLLTVATILGTVVVVGGALLLIGGRTGRRASARARAGISPHEVAAHRTLAASLAAVAVVAVAGGLWWSGHELHRRDRDVVKVRVVAAALVDGQRTYEVTAPGGDTGELRTTQALALGERVLTRAQPDGTIGVVRPLDRFEFGLATALVLFGLGLLSSAAKSWAWAQRCRRLQRWVQQGPPVRGTAQ